MTRPALLVLDQGTSVSRAMLFREGRIVAQARREVALSFPLPGHAEQDASELHASALDVLEQAAAALLPGEEVALGIATQRSTVILWDAETGRPFGPALTWRDTRAQHEARSIESAVPSVAHRTGLPAFPFYGAPKIAWALANWPAARHAAVTGALRVGSVATWLLWKLTLGESFTIDATQAQRLLLLDLETLEWDPQLISACELPPSALPQVLPTDGGFGQARIGGRTIPVRAMLGDQQAALLGLPLDTRPAPTLVQLGTGGFVMRDTGSACRRIPGLLTSLARADTNRERRFLLEGPVNAAGSALDRMRDVGLLREDDDIDALCAQATAPPVMVPAWAGLAAPWQAPGARAALFGWSESTTRADILLACVRGIAFLVTDVVDAMSAAGERADRLELSGSLSKLSSVSQAIADAAARPVRVRTNPEATLEGLATALAEAVGGTPPTSSAREEALVMPRTDLSRERAAFAVARRAAIELAALERPS